MIIMKNTVRSAMKKTLFALHLITIFLLGCEKTELPETENPLVLESKNPTKFHPNINRLSAFSKDGRLYTIHYGKQGLIDSVTITGDNSYSYRVFYKGSRIDSVNLIQDGKIASATNNYRYEGNLITRIDRWSMRNAGQPYPFIWDVVYDKKKRVVSPISSWTFTYDDNDLILSKITSDYPRTTSFFSYEFNSNPLYIRDLLFIFIEELRAIDYSFHKWIIKTESFNNGDYISYTNKYDNLGRLIKMAGTDNYGTRTTYEFFY
jgi:hypothetical protein